VAKGKTLIVCSIPPRRPDDVGATWADLAEVVCATHRKYAQRHGYDYHLDVSDLYELVRPTRRGDPIGNYVPIKYKIKFLLFQHFLDADACGKEYDHVVWFDSDLLITNYDIPLEKFFNGKLAEDGIGEDGRGFLGDIILTYDVNGLHATVIMMRRSSQTLGFSYANGEAGMRYFMTDDWSDQLSMRMFLETPPYQWLIWYHSVKSLCAMTPDTYTHIPERARKPYEWGEGDFALHLSAMSIEKRIELSKQWVERYGLL
jgi:hypothetical protein